MGHVKRIWYLSPMRAAKVQASLHICAVSPEPPLLAHTSSYSRGTFRQKARSLASLNGWECAVKICHDGMLEDTNSLDAPHMVFECFGIFTVLPSWLCLLLGYFLSSAKSSIKSFVFPSKRRSCLFIAHFLSIFRYRPGLAGLSGRNIQQCDSTV